MMDVRHRKEEDVQHGDVVSPPPTAVVRRPSRPGLVGLRKPWWRSWWLLVAAAVCLLAFGWWLFVLKWEWYCFSWQSWADPTLHDAHACRAVQSPFLERGNLLTAAFGFRAVYEGRLDAAKLHEAGLDQSPLVNLPPGSTSLRVVVKELKDPTSCGDVKAHFRELAIERRLRHPSIVPYFASCSVAPHYILVSEYMEGGTLSSGITPGMSPRTYLSIMLDLAKGLEYLHYGLESGATLIHDDLNPEQILLNAGRKHAYITDFNLASWIRRGERWGVRRYWWPKGGSWKWFAPEKLRLDYYWEAADVWSYGVLFYQTLVRANGQKDEWTANVVRPFYEQHILNARTEGWRPPKPRFRSGAQQEVLDEAWGLVERCWQFDPYARPNATQLVTTLEGLLTRLQP